MDCIAIRPDFAEGTERLELVLGGRHTHPSHNPRVLGMTPGADLQALAVYTPQRSRPSALLLLVGLLPHHVPWRI